MGWVLTLGSSTPYPPPAPHQPTVSTPVPNHRQSETHGEEEAPPDDNYRPMPRETATPQEPLEAAKSPGCRCPLLGLRDGSSGMGGGWWLLKEEKRVPGCAA
ncbi:hypothetical protein E2562_006893 [Oryza meyeriana var. granulata]|uniref:Uncharacterized protein n=1 Tax=Oryza meyeriana var. granulata TaxID=110450 RepID=A0A6G1BJK8_9ORYZ|nr:hypothetical protein E2562_006893 [Oryza meyeriana var. granulata]